MTEKNRRKFSRKAIIGDSGKKKANGPRKQKASAVSGKHSLASARLDNRPDDKALRESEARFHIFSEQALLAIVILQNGLIKYANQVIVDITGYSIEDMLNLKKEEFVQSIHPEDREFILQQSREIQKGAEKNIRRYNFRLITKTKKIKWLDVYSKTIIYEGKPAEFVSMIDVTVRKRAEELLQKAHDELEFLVKERTVELTEANRQLKRRIFDLYTIFELSRNFNAVLNYETLLDSFVLTSMGQMGAARAALYLPDQSHADIFCLARTKGSPPYPDKEITVVSRGTLEKFITAFNRPVFIEELIRKLSDTGENIEFAKYFDKGLLVPLIFQTKLRGILIISEKQSGLKFRDEDIEFLSILANQTAVSIENARLYDSEKEALNKLQKTQRLLIQSERMAVLGELSAKVAHEVNNPLGIIKNYLHLLSGQIPPDNKSAEYMSILSQEINRIAQIVRQLLDASRAIHVEFRKVNLGTLLKEITTLIQRQLDDASIKLVLDLTEPLPAIAAWSDGLRQVFMNLIINARDAIKSDGSIFIEAKAKGNVIEIFITDTGPGIKPEHLSQIFEPFFSTKDFGTGTGLGLSVCNSIIKKHNGTIEACPAKKGGCFRIELPIQQEEIQYDYTY